jgi:hypothetical protein
MIHHEPKRPRRLYVVKLQATSLAVVIARGRELVEKALCIPNWTHDDDFEIAAIRELTDAKHLSALDDVVPDADDVDDVPDGTMKEILEAVLEEQRQAKIEAEFRAKQISLLDSCGSSG